MSVAEIPPVPASILKRKSNVFRAIDTTRHAMETRSNDDGTATTSIVKRAKIPSTKALVPVPIHPQKRFDFTGKVYADEDDFTDEAERRYSGKKYDEYWKAQPKELAEINRENYESEAVAKYEFNRHPDRAGLSETMHSNLENRKKQKRTHKTWYPDAPIYDTTYTEVVEKAVQESSKKFRKAPPRNARELGLAKKSTPTEPPAITAISERKRQTKSELVKKEPSKSSTKSRNYRNDPDWLIDQMFDQVVNTGKVVAKAGKTVAKEGFQATKTGIRAIGELGEEFERTPIARNWKRNVAAEYAHMKSAGRRARGSIAGTGNTENKRIMTAGNLLTQRGVVARSVTNDDSSNSYGITAKYEKWVDGRTELHYFRNNDRLTHKDVAQMLSKKKVMQLKKEAKNGILVRRKSGIVVNKPKSATASKLTRKTHAGVV